MKLISKLFLMGAVALGLAACNNEEIDVNQPDSKANTHVSVTLSMAGPNTRALPNDYNYIGEWAGQDKIENVTIYLIDGTAVNASTFTVGTDANSDYIVTGQTIEPTENAAIKTTAGDKKVYVLVNATAEVTTHLAKTPVSAFEDAYNKVAFEAENSGTNATVSTSASKIAKVDSSEDIIVMTNVAPGSITVKPNITKSETIGASKENRVSLQVERAVARVMVTIAEKDSFDVPSANGSLGTITNVTWVLAQGENSLFVGRKSNWETPNYAWISNNTNYVSDAGDKYDYSGLFENRPSTGDTHFGGTVIPTKADYKNNVTDLEPGFLNGKFVLPTTHKGTGKSDTDYRKGNTAYVLIRAHFAPSDAAYADGGTYETDANFYVGANGKFYTSAANAVDPEKGGVVGQTVAKYEGGKVLYYAWVNPDQVPDWHVSHVLRNNIYHIHIKGFSGLGTNWNPLYPEDPERELEDPDKPYDPVDNPYKDKDNPDPKPTPEDPNIDEPTNPVDPEDPLTTPETWMSVDVTVLPWLVHSYEIEIGPNY